MRSALPKWVHNVICILGLRRTYVAISPSTDWCNRTSSPNVQLLRGCRQPPIHIGCASNISKTICSYCHGGNNSIYYNCKSSGNLPRASGRICDNFRVRERRQTKEPVERSRKFAKWRRRRTPFMHTSCIGNNNQQPSNDNHKAMVLAKPRSDLWVRL